MRRSTTRNAVGFAVALCLAAACGGDEEVTVRPLPEEPEIPVAADVETTGDERSGELESLAEAEELPPPPWSPPELGYSARQGKELFEHYCSTCHGASGRGDGFNAYNLDPKPRDLADPALQAERSDEELAAVIRSGGGAAGLSTGMPPWGRTLGERQIRSLVVFVRLLPELVEAETEG